MTNTASSRARPAPTLFSIVMMSSITRIRTARRRSSRLSTWLYSDGPLVPSWVASALMVSESHPSRSKRSGRPRRCSHGSVWPGEPRTSPLSPRAGGRPLTVLAAELPWRFALRLG